MNTKLKNLDKVVSLCKRRGYIFPGSEIYGGLANTWDYGPYGVELKNNLKQAWWQDFVRARPDVVGMDAAILMNPKVWEASGHVSSFTDPLMDCKKCKTRQRADKLVEEKIDPEAAIGKSNRELFDLIVDKGIACPHCGEREWTEPRAFNLMFKTFQGVVEDKAAAVYLRPETAQGIFVQFKNVYQSTRMKVPFGIGQIGKAFRNEITPGNFTFRTREFEQMELEFFCEPGTEMEWFEHWVEFCTGWLDRLGLKQDNLRVRRHADEELSHYSNGTVDIEYEFPFGWGELWGIASRTDFDLNAHMQTSGEDVQYIDQAANKKYVPYVIEPSLGTDRLALTILTDAYDEDEASGEARTVLRLHHRLAPVKLAILPLSKKPELLEPAQKLFQDQIGNWNCEFDVTGSIGKRYRRQDEIGTPFCLTFDFDSLTDHQVTVRERDSMSQDRIAIDQIETYIRERLKK